MKKFLLGSLLAGMTAAILAGCSSRPKNLYHAGDEAPPEFLAGGAGLLLTNVDGFSAKLSGSTTLADGGQRAISGDLLEREGSLIFQPANRAKGKRARREGGMFFIWKPADHAGYVCSDPLQGFAPASASVHPTGVTLNASGAVEEAANGHPCRKIEAVVQISDGTSAHYTVWQAEDAKHFPVRIQSPPGPEQMTINFFDIRLELPAPQLFSPPDGFVKYDSPVILMNDLIIRQSAMAKEGIVAEPGDPNFDHWRPSTPY